MLPTPHELTISVYDAGRRNALQNHKSKFLGPILKYLKDMLSHNYPKMIMCLIFDLLS